MTKTRTILGLAVLAVLAVSVTGTAYATSWVPFCTKNKEKEDFRRLEQFQMEVQGEYHT